MREIDTTCQIGVFTAERSIFGPKTGHFQRFRCEIAENDPFWTTPPPPPPLNFVEISSVNFPKSGFTKFGRLWAYSPNFQEQVRKRSRFGGWGMGGANLNVV